MWFGLLRQTSFVCCSVGQSSCRLTSNSQSAGSRRLIGSAAKLFSFGFRKKDIRTHDLKVVILEYQLTECRVEVQLKVEKRDLSVFHGVRQFDNHHFFELAAAAAT